MKSSKAVRVFRKADGLLIFGLLALCAIGFFLFSRGGERNAVITVDGAAVRTVDLSSAENEVIVLDTSPTVTLLVEDGTIRFTDSLCRDHTCEKSGRLSKPGDTAACLPAKTVVCITGSRQSRADAQSY